MGCLPLFQVSWMQYWLLLDIQVTCKAETNFELMIGIHLSEVVFGEQ